MTVHSRRMVSALLFFFSSFYLSSQEITPRYCAIPDNLVQDRIYSVKNNCTLRLTFRSEITEDQIEIKISPNDKWDEESGVPIRFVFEQETGDPNGKKIIELRFGLKDGVRHTLRETAGNFGITRERVRQIENAAKRKLRDLMLQQEKSFDDLLRK